MNTVTFPVSSTSKTQTISIGNPSAAVPETSSKAADSKGNLECVLREKFRSADIPLDTPNVLAGQRVSGDRARMTILATIAVECNVRDDSWRYAR